MFERVRKNVARKLFDAGKNVYAMPCRLRVDNAWIPPLMVYSGDMDETFDQICNAIEYYNCNAETGRYLHFYVVR